MIARLRSSIALLGIVGTVVSALCVGLAMAFFQQVYADRVFPGVRIDSATGFADLGGTTRDDAFAVLTTRYERYLRRPLVIRYEGREWHPTPRDLGAEVDVDRVLASAFAVGREPALLARVQSQILGLRTGIELAPPRMSIDDTRLTTFVAGLARDVDLPPTSANMALKSDQSVVVLPSRSGRKLNVATSVAQIRAAMESYSTAPITLVVDDIAPPLAEGDLAEARRVAEKIASAHLVLRASVEGKDLEWTIERATIAQFIVLRSTQATPPRYEVSLDENRIRRQIEEIAPQIERAPQNARFALEATGLKAIRPSIDGRRLEISASIDLIRAALSSDVRLVTLPWQPVRPRYATEDAATLEFPEVVQNASTDYAGTLPERMHNVELATSRINGVVVGPGDSFSFNTEVGEVSYRSGYKKGYGISQDGDDVVTIPSEGGGICQVATTMFQAAFWAGYAIDERNWHLYWIPRYGQKPSGLKGLDATIDQVYDQNGKLLYAVDLRWRNNTAAPVLVVATTDGSTVSVTLRGHKPDWQVKVAEPKIEKVVKANRDVVRQNDPSLAPGAQIMIEHAEDGFQATNLRTIVRDEEIINEARFVSTYRPSRNVYLVGGPAPRTSSVRNLDDRPATPEAAAEPGSVITPLPTLPTATPRPPATATRAPAVTPASAAKKPGAAATLVPGTPTKLPSGSGPSPTATVPAGR